MEEEFDLIESALSQEVVRDGHSLRVEIYSSGNNDWILEVVNESGTSTVWDGTFDTDQLAWDDFNKVLDEEGIKEFI